MFEKGRGERAIFLGFTRGRFEKEREGEGQYFWVLQQDGGLKKEEWKGSTFGFYYKTEI